MPDRIALAVSPHLDDAVFSAGGTLARLSDDGWRVVVATVFTRSVADGGGFALACQLDKGVSAEADYMALRREEDRIACARVGAEPRVLDFPEAPHRGYASAAALFDEVDPADRIEEPLRDALSTLIDALAPDLILAPQAIGGHVDHVLTTGALRLLDRPGPCLWWRDFPYVSREAAPKRPFAAAFAAFGVLSVPVDLARKRRACESYATQIGFQFGGCQGLADRLAATGGIEIFAHHPAHPPSVPLVEKSA